MKIVVASVLTLVTLAYADISLQNGYSYNVQQEQSHYSPPPPQQQSLLSQVLLRLPIPQLQALPGSINNPMQITQPSFQYVPAQQYQYPQQQHQQQPKYQLVSLHPQTQSNPYLPMPTAQHAPVRVVKHHRRPRPRVKIPKKTIITKNFFIHSAPEESEEELQEELSKLAEQPRKHYNVLFVKTPTQTSKAAAVNLAKTLKQEKTVVYVLSKKTSAADIQDAIQEAPQHINKPDVFFIKYRTPEEAEHAQRQIQSQYDSLGGSTVITEEGLAPVTSVVGSLDEPEYEEDSEEEELVLQQPQASVNTQDQFPIDVNALANSQYLPPTKKK
ncbi:uncharacterized protein TwdlW [Eurosta solidaginis]|uniref:uncharacterized protein TwdlW n=1 Tax=Eurosta solidaginis TaxID=178769 RepID=UPI0035315C76